MSAATDCTRCDLPAASHPDLTQRVFVPTGDLATRTMHARWESVCPKCMTVILPTMRIAKVRGQWIHLRCCTVRQALLIPPSCT